MRHVPLEPHGRPQHDRPAESPSRGDLAATSDADSPGYDPLDHVPARPNRPTSAVTMEPPSGRQLGRLVERVRDSVGHRFGALSERRIHADTPVVTSVDRPDLPDDKPAVYGHPTKVDAFGTHEAPPLFDGPPRRDEVRQGYLNDCWIMSALSAVVGCRPEAVRDLVRLKPSGHYEVRLHDVVQDQQSGDWIPTGKRLELDVTPDLPVDPADTSTAMFADTSSATWVAILEKAFAGLDKTNSTGHPRRPQAGYDRLDEGGTASDTAQVLAQLTGERAGVIDVCAADDPVAETERVIGDALAAGKPVVVGTICPGHPQGSLPYGFHGPHAYDVTAMEQGTMTLRNPLGMLHPQRVNAGQLAFVIDGEISTLR